MQGSIVDSQRNPFEAPSTYSEEVPTSSEPATSICSRPLILIIFVAWGGFLGSIWSAVFDYPWQAFKLSNCPEAIGMAAGGLLSLLVFGLRTSDEK